MNMKTYIASAKIDETLPGSRKDADKMGIQPTAQPALSTIDLAKTPPALVTGATLLDVSQITSPEVRAGVSLAMLFAQRVATAARPATDDLWLAEYQKSLSKLGFSIGSITVANSKFKDANVSIHKALIPFLTLAFGAQATAASIIIGLLENLQKIDQNAPWITAFERQTVLFDAREMHFAYAVPNGTQTDIRYAVARISLKKQTTQFLFFKIKDIDATYEHAVTTMSVSNSLVAVSEDDLKLRLAKLIRSYIWDVPIS